MPPEPATSPAPGNTAARTGAPVSAPVRWCRGNGRFPYTGTTSGPAKIIAGASGCMDLPRTRGMSALMASRYIPYRPDNGTWLNAAEDQPWP